MAYVPERGDAAWLSFDPQLGHEQQGRDARMSIRFKVFQELLSNFISGHSHKMNLLFV